MSEFYTRGEVALWLQPNGPNTAPVYLGCHQLDSITEPLGDNTLIRCPDPAQPNAYRTIGKVKSPPDLVTFSVNFRVQEVLDYLETIKCPVTVFAHLRKCGRADLFTNYERTFILQDADVTSRGIENLAALEANDATVNASADFQALPPVMRVKGVNKLLVERLTTAETRHGMAIWFCDPAQCTTECGGISPGCKRGFISTYTPTGSATGKAHVLYTTDGETWSVTATDPLGAGEDAGPLVAFYVGPQTVRVVVARGESIAGSPARVVYSDDNGATWKTVSVGNTDGEYILALWTTGNGYLWAGTSAGNIYYSADSAASWTLQAALGWTEVRGIHFLNNTHGVAVGAKTGLAAIAYTVNGGQSWIELTPPSGAVALRRVQMIDYSRWWVEGNTGVLYYTIDAGSTWQTRALPVTPSTGGGLQFVNALVGFVSVGVSSTVQVWRTIDGGYTWEQIAIPYIAGVHDLWACSANEFYLVGQASDGTTYIAHGV